MAAPSEHRPSRRTGGVLSGLVLATLVPASTIVTAALWDNGIIDLDPDGALVSAVQALQVWGLLLGPIGLVVVGYALRLRGILAWLGLMLWGIPVLAVAWFVGAAWLGGLAGEPF